MAQRKAKQARVEKRFGSESATVFTPPRRELTCKTSHGFEVIQFAETVLKIQLYPWQKWVLIHALELTEEGKYRFRTVVLLVARQNGKSTLLQVWALWRMYADRAPLTIGTAQNLDIAEEQWSAAVAMAEENQYLSEEIAQVNKTNGKYSLKLRTGERYKVAAATRKGGRGLSGDLVIMDELREHSTWDSWSAVTKTTMARPKPQVLCASNAGDASSVVLRHLWTQARTAIKSGDTDDETLGLFEFAALRWNPTGGQDKQGDWQNLPTGDRDGWAMANPSMNHEVAGGVGITEDAIEAAYRTDPDPVFRVEVLCQWLNTASGGAFEDGLWEKKRDPESQIVGDFYYAVDMNWDRSVVTVAVVGLREDGRVHGEVVTSRQGSHWVKGWFRERIGKEGLLGVVLQSSNAPVASLLEELKELKDDDHRKHNIVEWNGTELGRGTGQFYDLVRQDGFRHLGQPLLDVAVNMATTRPVGDTWVWDRKKSLVDISALVAVTGGTWAVLRPVEAPDKSAYDNEDLIFV